ncbi:T9SS outer membrane translocon Sov/SprA [Nonlabens ponticola]|uniref:Cell surface protein SprA n=1 Tax=Nonlabens ponticola TaxID=2496866 RepID=A0A3S9N0W4_9FLAO|nr:cell surface protein SprA [Nonlabens ponticola]
MCVAVFAFAKAQDPQSTPQDSTDTGFKLGKITLPDPPSVKTLYIYDPVLDRYIFSSKFKEYSLVYPYVLNREEYQEIVIKEQIRDYFREKAAAVAGKSEEDKEAQKRLLPNFYVDSELFTSIFGSNEISFDPQGSVQVDLGLLYNKTDNPSFSPRNRENFTFDFNQQINLSLVGTVGTRLNINANYDTESNFNFQNQIKLDYTPTEDDILQSIEVGNVAMPLNSQLIRGAQSLFGVKAELQFGKTRVTAVFSEQQSEARTVNAAGGATINEFDFFSLDYDENRHYFLSHYFRDNYDETLENYPFLNTNIQITRAEVWVTNRSNRTEDVRNLVAIQDIGESDEDNIGLDDQPPGFINSPAGSFPSNRNNDFNPVAITNGGETILNSAIRDIATVQQGFGSAQVNEGFDYAILENARKLNVNEYKLNTQLGYISLNQRLSNDEVLAVAFQYTVGGQVFQVGEFANDGVNANDGVDDASNAQPTAVGQNLVVKLLKSNLTNVTEPIWDLMMKNIYNLGGSRLSPEDFRLNIFYQYPPELNYLTPAEGTIDRPAVPLPDDVSETTLIRVFNLDRLNQQLDPQPAGDGFFDYVPGITIDPDQGRIIFTTVEPFGEHIFDELDNTPGSGIEDYNDRSSYNANQARYVYRDMYRTTKAQALQNSERNKYLIKGEYKATGQQGIPVGGFNLPRGSVTVTAGGRTLQEGIDYTVDYAAGRVIILDQALLNSNTPIQVSTESNSLFNQQTKRFTGINVEHQFSEDFIVGGTFLNLKERPITQKSTYGLEPINNTIVGANFLYNTEVPFLTRLVNKLPNVDTDVQSNLSLRGEFAYLFPGSPDADDFEGRAAAYVDDFEGSQTTIDILSPLSWNLSSTPVEFQDGLNNSSDPLEFNYRRARLAWYTIDPIFYGSQRPGEITDADLSEYRTRRVFIDEIFPQVDLQQGQQQVINTLDLAFYPDERGTYNYNPEAAGTNTLPDPGDNWGGITRQFLSTDFEQTNVEYIQFWMMDPFMYEPTNDGGTISFNLGSISEDILKDNRKQYENGLPEEGGDRLTIPTAYGKVPLNNSLIYAFDTEGAERANQDIGLDGFNDEEETAAFPEFGPEDPANDNYEYFLAASGDILQRYKRYNNTQGNSPVEVTQTNRGSTTQPDVEDINRDNTMNTIDSYFQYDVDIFPGMDVGNNRYINDSRTVSTTLPNGSTLETRWVQFRIPLNDPERESIGGIDDFRAIRFLRMYMTDFEEDTFLRFGSLDLVRGDYRRFTASLDEDDPNQDNDNTSFEVEAVNIENNDARSPIPYRLPPGVVREELRTQNQNIRQNEQSLALRVCGLEGEDSRAVFKNIRIDMRQYEELRMFVHAESLVNEDPLNDGDMQAFIRIGVDFTENYYEIRLPLQLTPFNTTSPQEIWPEANEFQIDLSLLQEIKSRVLGDPTLNPSEENFFNEIELDESAANRPNQQIYGIKGNPNFGDVRTVMLGIRNSKKEDLCGEVWYNELRLSGLKNEGGYAAILNMDANMADFATVSATGRRSTIGFGSIEQGPNERNRENVTQYDVTTSMSLGMLFPEKWGLRVPFSYSIGEETVTPQFDPQFEDIELDTRLANAQSDEERDAIEEQSEEYTRRQSVNLIGVTKQRTGDKKPMPYDIENFVFSGSYNQTDQRDFEIEEFKAQSVNVNTTYNYAFPELVVEPFKNADTTLAGDYLKFVRDFNVNLLPNNFTAGASVIRQFNTQTFRDLQLDTNPVDLNGDGIPDAQNIAIDPLTNRNFTLANQYAVNWDLTNSLNINFAANNNRVVRSYINDDDGSIDEDYTLFTNFFDEGIPDRHTQRLAATYQLPLDKIPFLAFAKATYTYTADFLWQRNSQQFAQLDGIPNLGNSVSNNNSHRWNGTLDLGKLYTYVGLEKKKFGAEARRELQKKQQKQRGRSRNTLPTKKDDAEGKEGEEAKVPEIPKENFANKTYNTFVGILTAVKRATINYEEANGIFLPGYLPDVGFIGTLKPTTGFTFGSQAEVRDLAARNGWLTLYEDFNEQYTETESRTLGLTFNVDLLPDLKIDLNANRQYTEFFQENYRVDPDDLTYQSLTPQTSGNFQISTIMIGTSFGNNSIDNSTTFNQFRENRIDVANRLAREFYGNDNFGRDDQGFPLGFSRNSQKVLLPSFLSAYEGRDADDQDTDALRDIPLPNWQIKYTGLMNLKWFKKRFKRFSLQHGYQAGYTINRFQTNLDFSPGNGGLAYEDQNQQALNQNGDFKPEDLFFNVNLVESFSPLLKVDFEMRNSMSIAAELRRDRAISLSFDNNLLTEINSNQLILGVGYRIKDVPFKTKIGGRSQVIKSDLNLRLDGSIRDNITIIRYLDLENSQATAGQTIYGAKFTAEYALSRAFTAIFYYDHSFSEFAISTAFPQTTIRSGIRLRYTFGN